jgi:hypothetical protein
VNYTEPGEGQLGLSILPLSIIFKFDFGTVFNLFYYVIILVNHAMVKPVISRSPINWKHESTVEVNWKTDEMNFPLNLSVNVDLYYPKVGDLFGIFGCALDVFRSFFRQYCCSYTIRNGV